MKTDNEIIAEFMKCSKPPNTDFDYFWRGEFFKSHNAKWNTSWDWLMPVVEKIDQLWMGCGGDGDLGYMCDQVLLMHLNAKISKVHGAVVHFVKWYNQQPT